MTNLTKELIEVYDRMQKIVDSIKTMNKTADIQSERISLLLKRVEKLESK